MQYLRFFFFPFAAVYRLITGFRNFLYDRGIFKSYHIPMKSICIGNLSLGGTGKSPLVAFLTAKLTAEFRIQILSRGYGRKTSGFFLLNAQSDHEQVGDEPMMYYQKFQPEIDVAVCESRTEGVKQLMKHRKGDLLLLDDAFQHRKVKAGFSILVSDFSKPFYNDFIVPVGRLREGRNGKKRADLLLISKCPEHITSDQKQEIIQKTGFQIDRVFFSSIAYTGLHSFSRTKEPNIKNVLLVTGIANPKPLIDYLSGTYRVEVVVFKDHHNYNQADIVNIHKKFDTFATDNKAIITSEKDFVRLVAPKFSSLIAEKPWYYQEISIRLDREEAFLEKIKEYVRKI